jgi:hypothetical protein
VHWFGVAVSPSVRLVKTFCSQVVKFYQQFWF